MMANFKVIIFLFMILPLVGSGCMGDKDFLQASPLQLKSVHPSSPKPTPPLTDQKKESNKLLTVKPAASQEDRQKSQGDFRRHDPVYYYGPKNGEKVVALTFDDGPDDYYTLQILDILKREKIKATFFVVGQMAARHPSVLKKIDQEGHIIGNHTWDHQQLPKLSENQVKNEVLQPANLIFHYLGKRPLLFRPPYGALNSAVTRQIAGFHYKIIQWSIDTRDWAGPSVNKIVRTVMHQVRPGSIILQHSLGGKSCVIRLKRYRR